MKTDQNLMKLTLESVRDGVAVQLKKLHIFVNLSLVNNIDSGLFLQVAPEIVAGAAMKLETLRARLSSPQLEAIISKLAATEDSRLRQLEHYGGRVNLPSLDPEVVAGALVKLESIDSIPGSDLIDNLSPDQLSALFSRIRRSPVMRLCHLILTNKDLSLVPPEDLVGAIKRLEVVQLLYGRMTAEQLTAILTMAKEDRLGRIKNIKISFVAGRSSVSPSLLQEARRLNNKLKWFG